MWKVNLEKKSRTSHWEISFSCSTQEKLCCGYALLSNFRTIICPVVDRFIVIIMSFSLLGK